MTAVVTIFLTADSFNAALSILQLTLVAERGKTNQEAILPDEYTVTGIFDVGYYDYNANIIAMSLENAQDLYDLNDDVALIKVDPDGLDLQPLDLATDEILKSNKPSRSLLEFKRCRLRGLADLATRFDTFALDIGRPGRPRVDKEFPALARQQRLAVPCDSLSFDQCFSIDKVRRSK